MKKGEMYEGIIESIEFPNKGIVWVQGENDAEPVRVIVKNGMPGQKIRCGFLYSKYACGILCCKRRYSAHGKNTVHGHCLDVRLNSGASAAVTASD